MGWHYVRSIVELRWSNKGGRLASVCLTLKHTVADCLTFERDILVTHIALIFQENIINNTAAESRNGIALMELVDQSGQFFIHYG